MAAITNIPFDLNLAQLLETTHTRAGTDDARALAALVERAGEVARPKALYRECFIQSRTDDTVTIDGVTFVSRALRMNLDQVQRVFPYIVTCGTEVDAIDTPQGDFLQEFWLDAIKASLLQQAGRYLRDLLDRRYRLGKTSAMSPGAGDIAVAVWPIEQQRELFSLFGDVEALIGVRLTDSCLMVPNKTVSGIRFPAEIAFESCQLCRRENCVGRRAPFDQAMWDTVQGASVP